MKRFVENSAGSVATECVELQRCATRDVFHVKKCGPSVSALHSQWCGDVRLMRDIVRRCVKVVRPSSQRFVSGVKGDVLSYAAKHDRVWSKHRVFCEESVCTRTPLCGGL